MKKVLCSAFAVTLVTLSLVACGKSENAPAVTAPKAVAPKAPEAKSVPKAPEAKSAPKAPKMVPPMIPYAKD